MTDQNTLILVVTIISFIQIVLLAWIKYRQSECRCGNCKGTCTKIKDVTDDINIPRSQYRSLETLKV